MRVGDQAESRLAGAGQRRLGGGVLGLPQGRILRAGHQVGKGHAVQVELGLQQLLLQQKVELGKAGVLLLQGKH